MTIQPTWKLKWSIIDYHDLINWFAWSIAFQGSLIEGMYWKRRMEAVCAQYKRWRYYFRMLKTKRMVGSAALLAAHKTRKRVGIKTIGTRKIEKTFWPLLIGEPKWKSWMLILDADWSSKKSWPINDSLGTRGLFNFTVTTEWRYPKEFHFSLQQKTVERLPFFVRQLYLGWKSEWWLHFDWRLVRRP